MTEHTIKLREPRFVTTTLQSDCHTLIRCGMRFFSETAVGAGAGAATGGVFGAMIGAGTSAFASRQAIGDLLAELKKLDLPELGWTLCQRSMCHAIGQLYDDISTLFPALAEESHTIQLVEGIRYALNESNAAIDARFFSNPSPEFVRRTQSRCHHLLVCAGFTENNASRLTSRLPAYFCAALSTEFRINKDVYARLLEATETPFDAISERRFLWLEYANWLNRRQSEPLFNELFCLHDVFIPLRCESRSESDKHSMNRQEKDLRVNMPSGNKKIRRHIHDLSHYLFHWLEELTTNYNTKNALRILSGGPGSGKSTSARSFAAAVAMNQHDWHVVYVPLHQFEFHEDLDGALTNFCKWHDPRLPGDLLSREAPEQRILLIYDGLDELSKQGDIGAEAAKSFAEHVVTWLTNRGEKRTTAMLLCGRPVAASRAAIRGIPEEHILHMLPYYVFSPLALEVFKEREGIHDPLGLLSGPNADQRNLWWQKFGDAKGHGISAMPKSLRGKGNGLDEITAQPLLNYLIALTYERALAGRSHIDFSVGCNLNTIYGDMLQGVWERKYECQQSRALQNIDFQMYQSLLEDIALAAWHGTGRSVSLQSVERALDRRQRDLLKELTGDIQSGILRLFLGFYIQSKKLAPGLELFEFTHKSFGEYLTARRMIETLRQCDSQFQQRHLGGYRAGGWDEQQCLVEWSRVFGPSNIDHDLERFIGDEFASRTSDNKSKFSLEQLLQWRSTLISIIEHMLRFGMPMQDRKDLRTFQEMQSESLAAEEALLVLHHNISLEIGKRDRNSLHASKIRWPTSMSFANWFSRLWSGRQSEGLPLFTQSLGYLDLRSQSVRDLHLAGANLSGSDLTDLNLSFLDFSETTLSFAQLRNCKLTHSRLKLAKLEGADLSFADCERSNFLGTDLTRANLIGCNMTGANLLSSNMLLTNIKDTNFANAQIGEIRNPPKDLELAIKRSEKRRPRLNK